jgi:hypothetical protein
VGLAVWRFLLFFVFRVRKKLQDCIESLIDSCVVYGDDGEDHSHDCKGRNRVGEGHVLSDGEYGEAATNEREPPSATIVTGFMQETFSSAKPCQFHFSNGLLLVGCEFLDLMPGGRRHES